MNKKSKLLTVIAGGLAVISIAVFSIIVLLNRATPDRDYAKLCSIIENVGSAVFDADDSNAAQASFNAPPASASRVSETTQNDIDNALNNYGLTKEIDLGDLHAYCRLFFDVTYGFVKEVGKNNDLSLYRYKSKFDYGNNNMIEIDSIEVLDRGNNSVTIYLDTMGGKTVVKYTYIDDNNFGFFAVGKLPNDKAVFSYTMQDGEPKYTCIEIADVEDSVITDDSIVILNVDKKYIDFETFAVDHAAELGALLDTMSDRIDEYHGEYFELVNDGKELMTTYRAPDGRTKQLVLSINAQNKFHTNYNRYTFSIVFDEEVWEKVSPNSYRYVPADGAEEYMELYSNISEGKVVLGFPHRDRQTCVDYLFASYKEHFDANYDISQYTVKKNQETTEFFGSELLDGFDYQNKWIIVITREVSDMTYYDVFCFVFKDNDATFASVLGITDGGLAVFPDYKTDVMNVFKTISIKPS